VEDGFRFVKPWTGLDRGDRHARDSRGLAPCFGFDDRNIRNQGLK
jgi:hypothetical protein